MSRLDLRLSADQQIKYHCVDLSIVQYSGYGEVGFLDGASSLGLRLSAETTDKVYHCVDFSIVQYRGYGR